jgi:flagellar biosynthesis protein FlhA
MSPNQVALIHRIGQYAHLAVPLGAVVILLVLLVPLPTPLLDLFISVNLLLSVLVLLVSMYVAEPVKFTVFPSILLLTTLYRLALNVATSRLILLNGERGEFAAGVVIKAFGQFVIGGNYVVGLVIFIILLVIQFIVVNHGAVRSSEVMARFTLDALPGKQMAVDADLAAGLINETEAKRRREEISQAAEFHGSMDGAIRFTQRDAVASIIITVVNLVAGMAIGVVQHGLDAVTAAKTYAILTVGDGVAAAVPSLFVSVAAAIITTRAATESSMGEDVAAQLLVNPRPLFIAGAVVAFLGLLPGMPHLAFLTLAGVALAAAQVSRRFIAHKTDVAAKQTAEAAPKGGDEERIESLLRLDALALEVGFGLIPVVSGNASFLPRVREIRRQMALDLGIIVPSVHITDNLRLGQQEYAILLKGVRVAGGTIRAESLMAIDPGIVRETVEGVETVEPVFKMPALWIRPADRERALAVGYTVVDAVTVICTHLGEVIKAHAAELLGRQETRTLLDEFAVTHPRTVEEATPKALALGEVQRILQNLLTEGVPIRDLATILESVTDAAGATRDVGILTETARVALARAICARIATESGELPVLTLDPTLERQLSDQMNAGGPPGLALNPDFARLVLEKIELAVASSHLPNPILLCGNSLRPHLRKLTARFLPSLSVIAHGEVASNVKLIPMGVIGTPAGG